LQIYILKSLRVKNRLWDYSQNITT